MTVPAKSVPTRTVSAPPSRHAARTLGAAVLAIALGCGGAAAQDAEPPGQTDASDAYIDDRSGPSALVISLYNAVSRGEFARAFSYWGEGLHEGGYDAFVAGFEGLTVIEMTLGEPLTEGAAGSAWFQQPVAVTLTRDADGGTVTHSGCYTLRLAQPAIQEPPFTPLHIEEAVLAETDAAGQDALPADCG